MPKICVIGTGNWGMNHVRTLNELHSLGGIVELDDEKRNHVRKQFPEIEIFDSVKNAFTHGFNGFTVATPPESHYEIGKLILEAGFPVLIEKPMTLDVEESKQLVELADRKGLPLMVGHVLLFHPAIRKIKSMIQEGKIGNLQYLYSNRLNLGRVRTEENVFWSFAPHDISIFQYFVEKTPTDIFALFGLFDYQRVFPNDEDCNLLIKDGLASLKNSLPYYDMGYWTRYNYCEAEFYPDIDPATISYGQVQKVL